MDTKRIIIIGLFVLPFASFAAENSFQQLDKDNDGLISKEEAASNKSILDSWSGIDKNSDGKLEMSEFSAFETSEAYVPQEEDNEPIGAAPTD